MGAAASRVDHWERVRAAARDLFRARGFEGVTMAEIAEAAGVARATVFNYFRSKHALVEAITEEVILFYRAMLDRALADEETPAPLLIRSLFAQMGEGIEADRRFFQGVFREIAAIQLGLEAGELARRSSGDAKARLLRLVQRGQARGELNAEIDPADLTSAFHSLVNGTITDWLFTDPSESLTVRMRAAGEVLLSPVELGPARRARRAPRLMPPRRHQEGVT